MSVDTSRSEVFTISNLADEFALTPRAIRFYEDHGLLSPARRGARRIYSQRDRVRLKLVLRGKRLGMSLAEITEILDLYDADRSERSQLAKFIEIPASFVCRCVAVSEQAFFGEINLRFLKLKMLRFNGRS